MTNKNKIKPGDIIFDYSKDNTDEALNTDGYVDCAKKLGTRKSGNTGFSLNLGDDSLFAALYTGNGLTKRYIDLLSDDMTRQWVTIPEDTDGVILHYLEKLKAKKEFKNYGLAQQALLRLLTKANIDVLKIKGLMSLLSTPDGLKQLDARLTSFDLAKSVSTTLLLDNEENFDAINQTLTGVAETFTKSQTSLFSVMGVPPMLFGIKGKSLGGNDDNELRLYYDRIKSDQDEEMLDPFDKLKDYIIKAKDSKVNENEEYNTLFNSLWQQTENEKVEKLIRFILIMVL